MKEVTRVKRNGTKYSDTTLHSQIRKIMKKYIFVIDLVEIIGRILKGESIEGRLYFDKENSRLTFQPWYRKGGKRTKQRKLCDLDAGYLAETDKHIVRHERFPLSIGMKGMLQLLKRDQEQTENALAEREIIEFV